MTRSICTLLHLSSFPDVANFSFPWLLLRGYCIVFSNEWVNIYNKRYCCMHSRYQNAGTNRSNSHKISPICSVVFMSNLKNLKKLLNAV